jgi:hypothetical protein
MPFIRLTVADPGLPARTTEAPARAQQLAPADRD